MRLGQKIILIVYALSFIFLTIFYVPFKRSQSDIVRSYGLLWSFRRIDLTIWSMEIVTLSIVMALIFIYIGQNKRR
jgi:hypothetical protein